MDVQESTRQTGLDKLKPRIGFHSSKRHSAEAMQGEPPLPAAKLKRNAVGTSNIDPLFSRTSDLSRTIKQGTVKKKLRERQRRERRNFDDFCEGFLPNRLKNDGHFLNRTQSVQILPPSHLTNRHRWRCGVGGRDESETPIFASQVVGTRPKTTGSQK